MPRALCSSHGALGKLPQLFHVNMAFRSPRREQEPRPPATPEWIELLGRAAPAIAAAAICWVASLVFDMKVQLTETVQALKSCIEKIQFIETNDRSVDQINLKQDQQIQDLLTRVDDRR